MQKNLEIYLKNYSVNILIGDLMGECSCEGGGDCKTCKMPQFASLLVEVMSKNYKNRDEILQGLGVKKAGKNTYVINL